MSETPSEIRNAYRPNPNAARGIWRAVRRRFHLTRWDVVDLARRYGDRWRAAVIMLLIQAGTASFVWWQTHQNLPLVTTIIVIGLILAANAVLMFELNARRTKVIAEAKTWRKARTAELIDEIRKRAGRLEFTHSELLRFRCDILATISSCVASVYVLGRGTMVASLLIRCPVDDEMLRVIARSPCDRGNDVRYPRQGMLAWYAIDQCCVQVTGEVKKEYFGFDDRPYNSVISLPIVVDNKPIAAVSIDHPRRFLFDEREAMFQTVLRPYLRLLALTFTNCESSSAEPGQDTISTEDTHV